MRRFHAQATGDGPIARHTGVRRCDGGAAAAGGKRGARPYPMG